MCFNEIFAYQSSTGVYSMVNSNDPFRMGAMRGITLGNFIAIAKKFDFGIMMSLHMLVDFGGAFDFTGTDFWKWFQETGFKRYEVMHLVGPYGAAIAYK